MATRTPYEKHIERLRIPVAGSYVTSRECQVLTLYVQGVKRAEVARRLKVSFKSVDAYLAKARERLGASSVAHLVAMFATSGPKEQKRAG